MLAERCLRAVEISSPARQRCCGRPDGRAGGGEVLMQVAAAGVNRPDVLQRRGGYPPPPGASDLPGLEVAGRVAAVGPPADGVPVRWREGDAVCALAAGGGYAEYCAAPAVQCLPVPPRADDGRGGGAARDVLHGLDQRVRARPAAGGGVDPGARGSSGIGTTAIQLARAFGARVFATAGSADKCEACVRLGAEIAVNYREQDWVRGAARSHRRPAGFELILDMVGGDYVARNLALLAVDGRLVQIAFLASSKVELDLMQVMRRRLTLTGSTLRPRTPAEKGAIAAALEAQVWPLLAAGTVRPVIHATFPLARAADAHRMMEASEHIGKIVLEVA